MNKNYKLLLENIMVDILNTIDVYALVGGVLNALNNGNEAWNLSCYVPPKPGQELDLNTHFEIKVISSYLKNEQDFFNNLKTQLFLNFPKIIIQPVIGLKLISYLLKLKKF